MTEAAAPDAERRRRLPQLRWGGLAAVAICAAAWVGLARIVLACLAVAGLIPADAP